MMRLWRQQRTQRRSHRIRFLLHLGRKLSFLILLGCPLVVVTATNMGVPASASRQSRATSHCPPHALITLHQRSFRGFQHQLVILYRGLQALEVP